MIWIVLFFVEMLDIVNREKARLREGCESRDVEVADRKRVLATLLYPAGPKLQLVRAACRTSGRPECIVSGYLPILVSAVVDAESVATEYHECRQVACRHPCRSTPCVRGQRGSGICDILSGLTTRSTERNTNPGSHMHHHV